MLVRISEAKLRIVSEAMDRFVQWTLKRLTRESSSSLMWLKSCHSDYPDRLPFHLSQEPTTVKRYVNHWKQLIFYILRTFLLEESARDRIYGIHFIELMIIEQLLKMLNAYNEDEDRPQFDGLDNVDDEEGERFSSI